MARKSTEERLIAALINLAHDVEMLTQRLPLPVAGMAAVKEVAPVKPADTKTLMAEKPAPVSGVKYETLKDAVLRLAETRGTAAATAIFKDFKVTHAKQIPEERYAEALKAFTDALAAPEALA